MIDDLNGLTEELNRENEIKRRDQRVINELREQAKELYKIAYAKDLEKEKRKNKKKGTQLGFMLQSVFGKTRSDGGSLWLLKDLDGGQLLKFIKQCERIIERQKQKSAKLNLVPPH
jgi:hypothetical protein